METKDLRIGNYVSVEGIITEVVAICDTGIDLVGVRTPHARVVERSLTDIKPVSLDDKALQHCVFDKHGKHIIGIDNHSYYLKLHDGYIVLLNKKNDPVIHFWDVRYLHQLQNLYFALKGKEMPIAIKS